MVGVAEATSLEEAAAGFSLVEEDGVVATSEEEAGAEGATWLAAGAAAVVT
jgi:hypothetical protein